MWCKRAEEAAKGLLWPSVLFEEFGLTYYGPVDGHNLGLLIETFHFLKQQDRPVILHAITQKGRGFQPALEKQKKFHGLGPYDPETGKTESDRAAHLLGDFCGDAGPAGERERQGCRRSQRRCPTARRSICSGRIIPSKVLRCRHRRGACGDLRRGHGDAGIQAVLRDLLDLPAARVRSRSCMMSACRICRWCSAWTAPD